MTKYPAEPRTVILHITFIDAFVLLCKRSVYFASLMLPVTLYYTIHPEVDIPFM